MTSREANTAAAATWTADDGRTRGAAQGEPPKGPHLARTCQSGARRHVDIDTSDPEDRGAARRTMSHWIEETLEEGLRLYYNVERSLNSSVTKFQHVELVSAPHHARSAARAPSVL